MTFVVDAVGAWVLPAREDKGLKNEGRDACEPDECLLVGVRVGVEWNALALLVVPVFNADLHSEVDDEVMMRTMVGGLVDAVMTGFLLIRV